MKDLIVKTSYCIRRKVPLFIAALSVLSICFCGCANTDATEHFSSLTTPSGKITVVATIFPAYDFARNVGGDKCEVYQLLKPGAESHSYEPTPQDIVLIKNCDVFIYAGGESDSWIETLMDSVDMSGKHVISMLDEVDALDEEEKEGMREGGLLSEYIGGEHHHHHHEEGEEEEEHHHEEEVELDEHVWTSPRNAIRITEAVCECLSDADNADAESYRKNADDYVNRLCQLDDAYKEVISTANRNTIVVADRFPFRYLCEEYGLDYYGAFPGCSEDAEITASSLKFLADTVAKENIPVVFNIEFSNEKIADCICEMTDAKKCLLHSCHNVSQKDMDAGKDYISIMYDNLSVLKEALN